MLANLQVGLLPEKPGPVENSASEWLEGDVEDRTVLTPLVQTPSIEDLPFVDDLDPALRIKFEVLEDVLVITPQLPELEDETILEALRIKLATLFDEPLPRRVVVNLEFVNISLARHSHCCLLIISVWNGTVAP